MSPQSSISPTPLPFAAFSDSLSFSHSHSFLHCIEGAKSAENSKPCLWCGFSNGKLETNGFHEKCLKQFLALPEHCRTCALIWVDIPKIDTICLLWLKTPKESCDCYTPWWKS
ncbi:MAG: hypothetical protein QW146_03750 [Candidatus Bathyarchaeia archaeon]